MCKRLVCFCHAMHVVFLLHRTATSGSGIEQLAHEPVTHCFFATAASIRNDPADGKRVAPVLADLERDLIRCTAYTPRLYLECRCHGLDGLLEDLERFFTGLLRDFFH